MKKSLLFSFFFLLIAGVFAQKPVFFGQKIKDYNQSQELQEQFSEFFIYEIDVAALYQLVRSEQATTYFKLQLQNDFEWDLSIYPHELRGKNYQLRIAQADGIHSVDPGPVKTFRGNVAGQYQTSTLTIDENFLYGVIKTGAAEYLIEPVNYFVKGAPDNVFVIYDAEDVIKKEFGDCALVEIEEKTQEIRQTIDQELHEHGERLLIDCHEIPIALAADWSMVTKFGTSAAASNHILGVLNNVAGNYDDEFQDQMFLFNSDMFISGCSSCDPWSSTTDAGDLLDDFRSWGNGGGFGPTADYATSTLWTNRNLAGSTIGIAYLNAICNSLRYSVCQDFTSNAQQLRVLQAHELGHNFSSNHDASGAPFIMAPAVNTSTQWSTQSINSINNYVNNRQNVPGCFNPCTGGGNPPIADFTSNHSNPICTGTAVQFFDLSTDNPTSWLWSFPGGTPSSSTQQNPVVTYNIVGNYNVTLTATNAFGSDAITKTNYVQVIAAPDAFFTADINLNVVNFTNLSNNATSYFWDFGDGGTSTQHSPTHIYATGGVYTVVLTAFNNCGSDTHTLTITIVIGPTANFIGIPTSGCQPLTVQFINQSSANSTSFEWFFPGGNPSFSTAQDPVVVYDNAGVYSVTLIASNSVGSDTRVRTNYIQVQSLPTANFSVAVNGSTVTCTNLSTNANSYLWDFGDGATSTVANPTHTYADDGVYTISLTATNSCGLDVSQQIITIATPPTANFIADNPEGCVTHTVNFINQSSSNSTGFLWSFPGGIPATSTDPNPTVNYVARGVYTVTLTATNAQGNNTMTRTGYISVEDLPIADFDRFINGTIVDFTNYSEYADSYFWDFGDGTNSTATHPSHNYIVDGSYSVYLEAMNECGSTFKTSNVIITTLPTANFSADQTQGCNPLTVSFSNQSSSNVVSYQWSFPGGSPSTSADPNQVVTYLNPGTYDVSLTVTNGAGSDSATRSGYITVSTTPTASFNSSVNLAQVQFTNQSSQNASSFSWNFGDGNSSTQANPSHTYTQDGTYTVVLTATNACGSQNFSQTLTIVTPPTAAFNSNKTSGCEPLDVQFANQSSANVTGFNWSFPGGNPASSNLPNPSVTYSTAGTYSVTLIVNNSLYSDTITLSNHITIFTLPTAGFQSDVNLAEVQFDNQSSSNSASYVWDFGDGNISNQENPAHIYTLDGTYTVNLTAINSCGTNSFQQTLTIITPPAAAFTSDKTSGCDPLDVHFTNQSSVNVTGFNWSFPGGNPSTSTEPNPTVTYSTGGSYSVTLIVNNSLYSDTVTLPNHITIQTLPAADFLANVNLAEVQFDNQSSSNSVSYVWDFGDGDISNEENPTHLYGSDGTYMVNLTAVNNCGTQVMEQAVTIVTPPTAGLAADVNSGCDPLIVHFDNQSSSNVTDFSWSFPGGTPSTSTDPNPVVTYNVAGSYDVMLIVNNSQYSDTIVFENYVDIQTTPTANFDVAINFAEVQFTNQSSANAVDYLWDFGDGTTSIESNPNHVYAQDGDYTVQLTAINNCGTYTFEQNVLIITPPTAGLNADVTSGCEPLQIQYANQSSSNATGFNWTFEGGSPATSTDANPVITYNSAGVFDVRLIVSNPAGADTIIFQNYVSIQTEPIAGFVSAVNLADVQFTNQSSVNATTYSWDFGDGTTSTDASPMHTYTVDGIYTVTLTAHNACGSTSVSKNVAIATSLPIALFSVNAQNGCLPFSVEFNNESSTNSNSFEWQFPGGNPATSTDANPVVTYNTAGTFDVILIAVNTLGNDTLTIADYITVGVPPVADFTNAVQTGATYLFSNASSGATGLQWIFPGNETSTDNEPTFTFPGNGVYEVTLIAENSCGTDTTTTQITVNGTLPVAEFSSDIRTLCAPATVNFTDNSAGDVVAWEWVFDGGNPAASDLQNPVVTYDTPGVYPVSLTVTNAFGTNMIMQTSFIIAENDPVADFTLEIDDDIVQFNGNAQGSSNYQWFFGDGGFSVEKSPVHTYAENGEYEVMLIVRNSCGTDTMIQTVVIDVVGLGDVVFLKDFQLFPNPSSGAFMLILAGESRERIVISITDALGRMLLNESADFGTGYFKKVFSVSSFAQGMYFIKIDSGDEVAYKKLIISK